MPTKQTGKKSAPAKKTAAPAKTKKIALKKGSKSESGGGDSKNAGNTGG